MTIQEAQHTLVQHGHFPLITPETEEDFRSACKENLYPVVHAYLDMGMRTETHDEWGAETPLIRAAEGNHSSIAQLLHSYGADLENRDNSGDTALHTAVNWGNFEVFKTLHELGAKVDTLNHSALTPITGALKHDQDEILTYLYAYANPNLFAEQGGAFLQYCLIEQNIDAATEAFQHFNIAVNPDIIDQSGDTLLINAVKRNDHSMVSLLLDKGANPNLLNRYGWTAYYTALFYGYHAIADLLRPTTDIELGKKQYEYIQAVKNLDVETTKACLVSAAQQSLTDPNGNNGVAILAETKGDLSFVQVLLDNGVNVHDTNIWGQPVLEIAVHHAHTKLIALLAKLKANPNRIDGVCHAFYSTIGEGNLKMTTLLVEAGANIQNLHDTKTSIVYGSGKTANVCKVFKYLGSIGADLNIIDPLIHDSLIGELAYGVHTDKLKALIEAGADLHLKDKNHANALNRVADIYHCKDKKAGELATYLLEMGIDTGNQSRFGGHALQSAISNGNIVVKEAIESFFERQLAAALSKAGLSELPDVQDSFYSSFVHTQNHTSLWYWVKKGSLLLVEGLLKAGLSPDPPHSGYYSTALGEACTDQDVEMVRCLLAHGADPNYRLKYGGSLIGYATGEKKEADKSIQIVQLLVDAGADINRLDTYFSTPYTNAIHAKSIPLMEYLHTKGGDMQRVVAGWSAPIIAATRTGNTDLLEWVIQKKADIQAFNKKRQNALAIAIEEEQLDCALVLMENGIDIHAADVEGNTPLILATKKGLHETIRLLLAQSANPYHKNHQEMSALDYAESRQEVAELFAHFPQKKSDNALVFTKVGDMAALTPLLKALYFRNPALAQVCIDNKTDLDTPNYRGDTPLMVAILSGQIEIARMLIDAGANVFVKNIFKEDAFTYCLVYGEENIKQMLEAKGRKMLLNLDDINLQAGYMMRIEDCHKAIEQGEITKLTQCLQSLHMDIWLYRRYSTPLHYAVKKGDAALTQRLLLLGAFPTQPDAYGDVCEDITSAKAIHDLLQKYATEI